MGANMPKQYLKLRGQEIALYSMQTFAGMPVRPPSRSEKDSFEKARPAPSIADALSPMAQRLR